MFIVNDLQVFSSVYTYSCTTSLLYILICVPRTKDGEATTTTTTTTTTISFHELLRLVDSTLVKTLMGKIPSTR